MRTNNFLLYFFKTVTFSSLFVLFVCFVSSCWPFRSVQVAACWTAASLMTQGPQLWPSTSASSTSASLRQGPRDRWAGGWMSRAGWQSRPQGSELMRQRLLSPFSNRWLSHGQQASRTVALASVGKQFQIIAHADWMCACCLENIPQYIPNK